MKNPLNTAFNIHFFLKKLKNIFFGLLITLSIHGFAQCTPVCIEGATNFTVTPTGTNTVYVTPSPAIDSMINFLKLIKAASYYTGIGSSQANLLSIANTIATDIDGNTNLIQFLLRNDTARKLSTVSNNQIQDGVYGSNYWRALIYVPDISDKLRNAFTNTSYFYCNYSGTPFTSPSLNSFGFDTISGHHYSSANSEYVTSKYVANTTVSDTLITSVTTMSDLVTAVNLFYAEHPNRSIKDVSYTNAIVTATLTYFAVIRYKD
jgi:hypothetical protein